jgi:hypothetical protein
MIRMIFPRNNSFALSFPRRRGPERVKQSSQVEYIQGSEFDWLAWIPAFAGMTAREYVRLDWIPACAGMSALLYLAGMSVLASLSLAT